jgi:hypothetical protein
MTGWKNCSGPWLPAMGRVEAGIAVFYKTEVMRALFPWNRAFKFYCFSFGQVLMPSTW